MSNQISMVFRDSIQFKIICIAHFRGKKDALYYENIVYILCIMKHNIDNHEQIGPSSNVYIHTYIHIV